MRFTFTDDQLLFRDAARDVLRSTCTPERVRAAWDSPDGVDHGMLKDLAAVGLFGALVPEDRGGMGLVVTDLALVLEETGRVALPGPLVETAVIAADVLATVGGTVAERWLDPIAEGRALAAVGFADDPLVAHAGVADVLLLEHDGALHLLERDDVEVLAQPSQDAGRRVGTVGWDAAAGTRLPGGAGLVDRARHLAAWGAAGVLVGTCHGMIDLSVAHASAREQFGRPIGAFQAVKHHLANALLVTEFARPAVYNAAHALATRSDRAAVDVAVAKILASDAGESVARIALQVHGAMGYTWEHDLHLWSKRAQVLAASHGDADHHRERVAELVLDA